MVRKPTPAAPTSAPPPAAPVGTPPPVTECDEDGHVPDPPRNPDGTCALCGDGVGEWVEVGALSGASFEFADVDHHEHVHLPLTGRTFSTTFEVGHVSRRALALAFGIPLSLIDPAHRRALTRTRTQYRQRSLARRRRNRS